LRRLRSQQKKCEGVNRNGRKKTEVKKTENEKTG
jgi:hypothetical protein